MTLLQRRPITRPPSAALLVVLLAALVQGCGAPSWHRPKNGTTVSAPDGAGLPGSRRSHALAASHGPPGSSTSAWLFGGWGADSNGNVGRLNDLWRLHYEAWSTHGQAGALGVPQWEMVEQGGRPISMGSRANMVGRYGARGVAGPTLVPSSRDGAAMWEDYNGDLFLFGGTGVVTSAATEDQFGAIRSSGLGVDGRGSVSFQFTSCDQPRLLVRLVNSDYTGAPAHVKVKLNNSAGLAVETQCYPHMSEVARCSAVWVYCLLDYDLTSVVAGHTGADNNSAFLPSVSVSCAHECPYH